VLSIFLCVSLAGVSLLAYQNMQLQRQIAILQSQPTPTPLPAEASTKEGDPTANWKTYNYSRFDYSFKLPSAYTVSENQLANPNIIQSINICERNASQGSNDFVASVQTRNIDLILQELTQDGFNKTGTKTIAGKEWTTTTSSRESQYLIQVGGKIYTFDGRNIVLLEQILSTFKFVGKNTNSDSSTYKFGTFSFSYPTTWKLSEKTTDPSFFNRNNLTGFDHMTLLQNGDYYLLLGIDTHKTGLEVNGIFTSDLDYRDYLKNRDQITIQGEKFFLWKDHTSLEQWNNPGRESGIAALASLSKYIPNKITNQQNQTFNGYDDYFQNNGNYYMFIKLSKTGSSNDITPVSIQNDIVNILNSIKW